MSRIPPLRPKTERVYENPVTHELEVTVLDAKQLVFERVRNSFESATKQLPNADIQWVARQLADWIEPWLVEGKK